MPLDIAMVQDEALAELAYLWTERENLDHLAEILDQLRERRADVASRREDLERTVAALAPLGPEGA